MKWLSILLIAVVTSVIIFFASPLRLSSTINVEGDWKEMRARLEKQIPRLMDYYSIPGLIIGLIEEGELAWSKAYGYAVLETAAPMTIDAPCRVESISKSVTAWGVVKLVQQGRIALDDPVADYFQHWSFPPSEYPVEKITVGQLLSHTAGMPLGQIGVRYDPYGDVPALEEVLNKEAVPMQEPGQAFSYSNTGYKLLELLIEEVSGLDFADYMKKEVLLPIGIQHSDFDWVDSLASSIPHGYDDKGRAIPPYIYPDRAAGGLMAPMEDIARFVAAGMLKYRSHGLQVLDSVHIQKLYRPEFEHPGVYGLAFDAYGLGHFIEWLPGGRKAVSHGGQGSGWMTHFHAVPESGEGIVILTNSQRSWPLFAYILKSWASWAGFSSIGMGKIIWATQVLWGIIGLLLFAALFSIWRLAVSWMEGRRHWDAFVVKDKPTRLIQLVASVLIVIAVVWCMFQSYLFLAAVFPVAFRWLLGVLLLSGILGIVSAFTLSRNI